MNDELPAEPVNDTEWQEPATPPDWAHVKKIRSENWNLRRRVHAAEAQAADAEDLRGQVRGLRVDLELERTFPSYGITAGEVVRAVVLFSNEGPRPLLDPDAPDFKEQVRIRIEEALFEHPQLGKLPAPTMSEEDAAEIARLRKPPRRRFQAWGR